MRSTCSSPYLLWFGKSSHCQAGKREMFSGIDHNESIQLLSGSHFAHPLAIPHEKEAGLQIGLLYCFWLFSLFWAPQWGAADAEIKVPSGQNTELKRSPFIAWSRSVYSHACYAYCQGFLPCLFLPFQSIHLHFFQNLSQFFPVLACRIK